jgi:hypothetical protein
MGLGCAKKPRRANRGEKHFFRCPFRACEKHTELRRGGIWESDSLPFARNRFRKDIKQDSSISGVAQPE